MLLPMNQQTSRDPTGGSGSVKPAAPAHVFVCGASAPSVQVLHLWRLSLLPVFHEHKCGCLSHKMMTCCILGGIGCVVEVCLIK